MSKKLREGIAAFNELYKVGTPLILKRDDGTEEVRTLKTRAWALGTHSAVALFEGISGGYDIGRVKQKMKYKHNDLGMSYMVPCDANGNDL